MKNISVTEHELLSLNMATKYDSPSIYNSFIPAGWEVLENSSETDDWYGYFGRAYIKDNLIIVANRGSADLDDERQYVSYHARYSNAAIDFGLGCFWGVYRFQTPYQFYSAEIFYNKIKNTYHENNEIMLTGFSIGGLLAELVSHQYGAPATVFDPPGALEIMSNLEASINSIAEIKIILSKPNMINSYGTHPVEPLYIEVDYQAESFTLGSYLRDTYKTHDLEKMYTSLSHGLKTLGKKWPRNIEEAYNHFLEEHNLLNIKCKSLEKLKDKVSNVTEDIMDSKLYSSASEYCDEISEFLDELKPISNAYLHIVKETWTDISGRFDSIFNNVYDLVIGENRPDKDYQYDD